MKDKKRELESNFVKLYRQLNAEQKEAVDIIEGPVMVVAGPGTGKTHLLSMRIANILAKTDTSPEAILALTFTESGVASMRRKLARIIGTDAYSISIATFHGFANEVIKKHPDEFLNIIGANNIAEVEQIGIVEKILDTNVFKNLRPFGDNYFYIRSIIHSIGELKKEGIIPEDFKKIALKNEKNFLAIDDLYYETGVYRGKMKGKYADEQKYIERNKELAEIYRLYQEKLKKLRFYDYNDMIMEVMKVLESNKDLLLTLQEQYLYILVDEHQDTNSAQNKILKLLANYYDNPNLFIVGDEKQAIFRFQGASSENFHYFKDLYKNLKVIYLKSNYRSTQTILNAAYNINSIGGCLLAKAKHKEAQIALNVFQDTDAEIYFLAKSILKDIEKLKKENKSPEEIAVLYRENKNAMPVARIFEKLGIPFIIESDQDVMNDEDIKKLLIVLKAAQKFGSGEDLIGMLHLNFLEIPLLDIYEIANDPYRSNCSDKIRQIKEKLSQWKKSSLNEDAIRTFEDIVRDSGFLNYLLTRPLVAQKLKKLHTLFSQIKTLVASHKNYTLNDFFLYLDMLREHNVLVKTETVFAPGRVRLMTAHKSKGLEFDYVYIFNAIDGQWGSRKNREYIKLPQEIYFLSKKNALAREEDEKNLFYVALTRARKKLNVSYSKHNQEGREQLATKFLQDIEEKYFCQNMQKKESEDMEKEIEFAPVFYISSTAKEKIFLNEIFYSHGLSATALNNYLECPWKYFYRNLIRIPEAPNKHLMFGSAVHNALSSFFDRLVKGESLEEQALIDAFAESLNRQPFQEKEYKEALEKGKKALAGYYKNYCASWKNNVLSEFNLKGIELADNILINGKIDKIEILDISNAVNVVDYKTGKPKTRNDLLGKTKGSDGNYYRQLVFYKLLLDNYQNEKFKVNTGEIDFIEPDSKGNYRKEIFEISKEDAKELKKKIITVANEIINLSFWDKTCKNPDCYYCHLRKSIN